EGEPGEGAIEPTESSMGVPMGTQPGEMRVDEFGIEQVWVPAGSFMMGSDDFEGLEIPTWAKRESKSESPQHEVTITAGYWIDKYEVTNAAYQAFIDAGGYENPEFWSEDGLAWLKKKGGRELPRKCLTDLVADHPSVCITWFEAEAYAAWRGGRLPTEAEWEYAARGPESLIYPWGNDWDATKANLVDSEGLMAVGSFPLGASWVGAMDMCGNAMEWVSNWLDWDYYQKGETVDPQGPESGEIKIEKGGWWGAPAFTGRASYHHFEDAPKYSDQHIGFRIVVAPITP
ncbi:MAG: formylglycine-generating enzyme family protein, partial [Anaerolineae bacterium]|nr:formylglycine-generating enzyme family protein [Anaerolineae bacterium]